MTGTLRYRWNSFERPVDGVATTRRHRRNLISLNIHMFPRFKVYLFKWSGDLNSFILYLVWSTEITVVVHPQKRRSCATAVNPVFSPYNEKPIGLALVLKRDLFLWLQNSSSTPLGKCLCDTVVAKDIGTKFTQASLKPGHLLRYSENRNKPCWWHFRS